MADKQQMVMDRLKGMTLQEVADKHGVSKQRVSQALMLLLKVGKKDERIAKITSDIVFPAIREWFIDHPGTNILHVSKAIGINSGCLTRKLLGQQIITIKDARAMMAFFGMTFEEAFRTEDGQQS